MHFFLSIFIDQVIQSQLLAADDCLYHLSETNVALKVL